MRTTVELPPELMRAAKARSAESGESLKSLLTRAVAAELQAAPLRGGQKARVRLPLFGGDGRRVKLSSADIERALADADGVRVSRHTSARSRRDR
jgi:hypothetical protein